MHETTCCADCRSVNILFDEASGEIVCMDCGVVSGTVEYTAPADRTIKTVSNHPIVYTSSSVGTVIEPYQRLEIAVAYDINRIIHQLSLPPIMQALSISYVRQIRSEMKKKNEHKIRFTRSELTALSLWITIKRLKHPLSVHEYLKLIRPFCKIKNLMRLEKRASYFIPNINRITDAELVTAYINNLISKLESSATISSSYGKVLGNYAIQMIYTNKGLVTCRRAGLVAASALYAADSLLAGHLRIRAFSRLATVGASNLSSLAEAFRRNAPVLPKEWASIQVSEYLFKEVGLR